MEYLFNILLWIQENLIKFKNIILIILPWPILSGLPVLLGNQHLWENFVIGESSAKISRFFPGFRQIFWIFPGLCSGGGGFHSSARNFVPLQVLEHLFELEKERIQDGLCVKFSATSKCVFCRIRNESFQGNPGIRLVFFTVNGILRGLGETDSWKKLEVENLVTLSL